MNWLNNISIGKKISLPVGILVLIVCALIFESIGGIDRLTATADYTIGNVAARQRLVLEITAYVNEATIQEKNILLATDAETVALNNERLRETGQLAMRSADELLAHADTPERREINQGIRDQVEAYIRMLDDHARLVEAGRRDEAVKASANSGREARLKVRDFLASRNDALAAELEAARAAVLDEAASTWTLLISSSVVGLALSLSVLGYIISRKVVQPLGSMVAGMSELATGNLNVEVTGTERKDEIGSLARALGTFKDNAVEARRLAAEQASENEAKMRRAEQLDQLTRSFDTSVRNLTASLGAAATEMEATATSMSGIAEQTSRASGVVATAAQQTSGNVQTVAAATEEMSASVKEIATQVAQSSQIANSAMASVQSADGKVRGLADAAERIGEVIDLISTIAGQTNLLALNATIEAARAGEAGRGFAVVAAEVKELANQTSRATGDISGQIAAIRSSTAEVVSAMHEFGAIIANIQKISTAVAAAMEEQDGATSEISRNVQQAARGTEEVTTSIIRVQHDAGQTGAAATQVLSAAQELARHSEELRGEVESFLAGVRAA